MGAACDCGEATGNESDIDSKARGKLPAEEEFEMLSPTFSREDVAEWTNCSLLIPHEPLRGGLNVLVELTDPKYYEDGDAVVLAKRIKVFYAWYSDIFYFYVHEHHDAEEKIYFPWLEERTEKLPQKLSLDHEELIEMMDAIKNGQQTFFDDAGALKEEEFAENLRALHRASVKLCEEMSRHLNAEEEAIPGLLRKHEVTRQEEGAVVDSIVKSLGLAGNKVMLPWIMDAMARWGGKAMVDDFKAHIPGPILFLNKMWWDDHYVENNKNIIARITEI